MHFSNTTKQILLLAIVLIVEAAIILTCHHSPTPIQGSSQPVDTLEWVNDAGDIVSSLQGTPEAFAVRGKEADSIAKVYQVKIKNLQEYIVALEHTNSDLLADIHSGETDYFPVDTNKRDCPPQVKNFRQTFTSPYYIAKAQLGDSPYLHLQAFDTLTVLWKKVNKGSIFNRKHLIQLDISTANPDTKVSGIKAYRIIEKPKKWAIGLSAGYGVPLTGNVTKPVPMISFGITKTFIRF